VHELQRENANERLRTKEVQKTLNYMPRGNISTTYSKTNKQEANNNIAVSPSASVTAVECVHNLVLKKVGSKASLGICCHHNCKIIVATDSKGITSY